MTTKKYLFIIVCSFFLQCSKTKSQQTNSSTSQFIKGADISWVTEMESVGRKFYTKQGEEKDPFELMKLLGCNAIRLRVWVNPSDGWNNAYDVLNKALRAKKTGLKLLINFHYSDSWADPGKQTKPSSWNTSDVSVLQDSIQQHTKQVLQLLKSNDVVPEWIQIGNETNNGMLWPEGKASINMKNFAQFFQAGCDAAKSIFPSAKIILHISNGFDNQLFRWLLDGVQAHGTKFDIIGMSLYPSPTQWQQYNQQCIDNISDLIARYQKEVMVVEVGMSWDEASNCFLFLSDLIQKLKQVPNQKGLGVFYWEPQSYFQWKGYTLGAFDNSGKPTIAMDAFKD